MIALGHKGLPRSVALASDVSYQLLTNTLMMLVLDSKPLFVNNGE